MQNICIYLILHREGTNTVFKVVFPTCTQVSRGPLLEGPERSRGDGHDGGGGAIEAS